MDIYDIVSQTYLIIKPPLPLLRTSSRTRIQQNMISETWLWFHLAEDILVFPHVGPQQPPK